MQIETQEFYWCEPHMHVEPPYNVFLTGPFYSRENAEKCAIAMMATGQWASVGIKTKEQGGTGKREVQPCPRVQP